MPSYTLRAADAARSLGVDRTTLVEAIKTGKCGGERIGDYWYTSQEAAQAWYDQAYKSRNTYLSKVSETSWTHLEIAALRKMAEAGAAPQEVSTALRRSVSSVRTKASRVGVSWRKAPDIPDPAAELLGVPPADAYQDRRQLEREGRVRLHLHPVVKQRLGDAARRAGLSLAVYVTRAGLAAAEDARILDRGELIARTIRDQTA